MMPQYEERWTFSGTKRGKVSPMAAAYQKPKESWFYREVLKSQRAPSDATAETYDSAGRKVKQCEVFNTVEQLATFF